MWSLPNHGTNWPGGGHLEFSGRPVLNTTDPFIRRDYFGTSNLRLYSRGADKVDWMPNRATKERCLLFRREEVRDELEAEERFPSLSEPPVGGTIAVRTLCRTSTSGLVERSWDFGDWFKKLFFSLTNHSVFSLKSMLWFTFQPQWNLFVKIKIDRWQVELSTCIGLKKGFTHNRDSL